MPRMPDDIRNPESAAPRVELAAVLARLDALTNWELRPRGGMRVDLEPMRDLMRRLDDPHQGFRSLHVAGTKGKGSVSALLESALLRAGWRAGRYASPHVEKVTERVSILGRDVDEAVLAFALTRVLDAHEAGKLARTAAGLASWFDILTASAFLMFKEAGLDWAVVEVGLGGRLDSTNVVPSEIAVVTNIELEHTEILGSTRAAIAGEKAGILKPGSVLVTSLPAEDEAGHVLQDTADRLGASVRRTAVARDATIADENRF